LLQNIVLLFEIEVPDTNSNKGNHEEWNYEEC